MTFFSRKYIQLFISILSFFFLILAPQTKPRVVQAREFPISAVRFVQEMGEASFGKVYRGELGGLVGGMTSMVAVKTLKPGANQQTRYELISYFIGILLYI